MRRFRLIIIGILVCVLVVLAVTGKDRETVPAEADAQQQDEPEELGIPTLAVQTDGPLGVVTKDEASGGILISWTEEDGTKQEYLFEDVASDAWYVPAINYVVSKGLFRNILTVDGVPAFHPDYGVTRLQFAEVLYRFAGGEPIASRYTYEDVSEDDWYYNSVNWVSATGLMTGVSDDVFGVNEFLSCEQVIILLHRVAGSPKPTATLEDYPYAPKVSGYGSDSVCWAWGLGLIAEEECLWYPTQSVSRAQVALLLMRFSALVGAAK